MGDEYCEEGCGDARGGDRKYPVSLGATCGYWERINGELRDGPEEGPACKPIETTVVTGELSNEVRADDSYRNLRETRGIPRHLADCPTCSSGQQKPLDSGLLFLDSSRSASLCGSFLVLEHLDVLFSVPLEMGFECR
jgi:hypothetical protein